MHAPPDPPVLLLVPTALESDRLIAALRRRDPAAALPPRLTSVALCGFGVAASAALTMHHLHTHAPRHVVLAGIAGSLAAACQVGSAYWFSDVLCDGIGVGEKEAFQSAAALRWNQVERPSDPIGDHLRLHVPQGRGTNDPALCLVTGCAASADAEMARRRLSRTRAALASTAGESASLIAAEDMEGFAVALACSVMNVPLSIVRGISNQAGDRDHAHWQIDAAIEAIAAELHLL